MQRIIIFLFSIVLPAHLFSIQNKFEYLTPDNGLSQANVECIFQDSKGFIWIGTFNGLNRFDGYEIRIFNHIPDDTLSLSHEHISAICEDSEGKLWLATYGNGVSVYFPETEQFRRIVRVRLKDQTMNLRQINRTVVGPEGNIWVVDENQGIFVFDINLKLVSYYVNDPDNPKSIPQSFYFSLDFDKDENGWFGVGNNMLCLKGKDSDDFEVFRFEDRIAAADDGIKSMYIDRTGNIWIGTTSQGAYKFNPKTKQFINYRTQSDIYRIDANTVMSFAEDWSGNLYIGTDGGGLNIIDINTGKINTIRYNPGNPESLGSNAVYAIFFDRSENLWIGTYSAGVNFQSKYKNKFRKYTPNPLDPNSLSYKNVTAFLEDRDGEIWIGTDGGGLNRFLPISEKFEHFRMDPTSPDWLQTDVIIHLMEDDEGDIYISSYNHGLTIFNKNEMTFKQYLPVDNDPTSLAGIHPWFTFQDSYGGIWVGMLAVGLDKFDKSTETFKHYVSVIADPTTLNSPNIKILFEDSDHRLWVGTEGGGLHLFNREDDNFTRFTSSDEGKDAITNDDIRALYEDKKGRFWVGTGKGLCLMNRDSGTFKSFFVEDGLPGNTINGILEDNEGFLWISTDAGISRFNPDDLSFRNYDRTDGLQGNEFNYTASIVASDGSFYFGGKNGFNVFKPEDIKDNPYPPEIVITEISILNKPFTTLQTKKRGKKANLSVSEIKKLKLTHKQNILSFKFAALDFGNSGKNQYKYILEGFDKEWNVTDVNRRFATYTNLPGGDYTFKVIASNGDGVWNTEGVSIGITITPPFYKRTWFILLILAAIVWFVVRYIRRREEILKRDKVLLENKIKEGLKEVNKQKEEVAQKDKILQEKIESEKEQNWYNIGMSKMSDVMSRNKDDLNQLAQSIITEIVEYLEVQQGAIYLLNDEDEGDKFLELMAAYAPDDKRLTGARVELDEGQVGTCFKEMSILVTLFLIAFVSATLLPLGSEPALFGLLKLNPDLFWPAILVATAGNTLGGALTWAIGWESHKLVDKYRHSNTHLRALDWLERIGPKACLLSWLPVIGDPLCAVAGWLRQPFWACLLYMAIGKLARYLTMTVGLLWIFPGGFKY